MWINEEMTSNSFRVFEVQCYSAIGYVVTLEIFLTFHDAAKYIQDRKGSLV